MTSNPVPENYIEKKFSIIDSLAELKAIRSEYDLINSKKVLTLGDEKAKIKALKDIELKMEKLLNDATK